MNTQPAVFLVRQSYQLCEGTFIDVLYWYSAVEGKEAVYLGHPAQKIPGNSVAPIDYEQARIIALRNYLPVEKTIKRGQPGFYEPSPAEEDKDCMNARGGYSCTRPLGHQDSIHAAHIDDDTQVARWNDDNSVVSHAA